MHGPCVKVEPAVVAVAFGVELHVALGVVELAIVGGYSGGLISIKSMQLTGTRVTPLAKQATRHALRDVPAADRPQTFG